MDHSEASTALRLALASALDIVADAVIMVGEDQRILFFNRGAEKIFGYGQDELLGQPLDRLLPPQAAEAHHHHIRAFAATPEVSRSMGDSLQVRGRRKDGSEFPAEASITKLTQKRQVTFTVIIRDVTDRQKTEQALRRWKQAFELAEWGIAIGNLANRTLDMVNPAFARMHGYTAQELKGVAISDVFAPAAREKLADHIRRAYEQGHHTFESEHLRRDGTIFPALVDATILKDESGHLLYSVVNVQDITERKQVEAALRESEERYRSIVTAMHEGVVFQAADGRIIACSASAEEILGLTCNQMIGRTSLDPDWRPIHEDGSLFPGETHPAVVTLHTGQPQHNVIMGVHKPDGTLTWISINSEPLFRPDETRPFAVVTSFTDITERRRAEQMSREHQALLRQVLEILPVGVWIQDKDGRIISGNEAGQRIWAGARYVGIDQFGQYKGWWADTGQRIEADEWAAARAITKGETSLDEVVNIECFDGTRKTILNSAVPIRDEHQNIQGAITVNQDITERTQAYQLLEQRVQERTRELSALLNVSRNAASMLELGPLLTIILEQLEQVVDYTGAAIVTMEENGFRFLDYRGPLPRETMLGFHVTASMDSGYRRVVVQKKPLIIEDIWEDTPWLQMLREQTGAEMTSLFGSTHSWMGVPLVVKDNVIGVLRIDHVEPGHFTEQHAHLAMAFASQVAVAIENARLYQQAQQLAALEERQRLARELHDSISQVLYSIGLGARTARTWLDRDPGKVAEPLDYVRSLAEAGLAEMRALIFELRPESLEEEGLVAAITKQANALRARFGIKVHASLCDEPPAPLATKEALYRITQETLHNVAKHARANRVELRLAFDDASLILEVKDDGAGFDTSEPFPGHLGLRSMCERAERVGGVFEVESTPGGGTRIRVKVPLTVHAATGASAGK